MKKICQICEKEVEGDELYNNDDLYRINAATVWPVDQLPLAGHKKCMENINKLVVIPNRYLVEEAIKKMTTDS